MNTSQPVASSIGSVQFGFLTSTDVRALSVKQIQNPTTFDSLLNPVPGGLYDPALGAWGDNLCGTCNLNTFSCPGHVGHIELPVPVYHPMFMDQLLRLLRAKCVYCHHFKLARIEVHRFCCKLKLIRHGLLNEAEELENISLVPKGSKTSRNQDGGDIEAAGSDSEGEDAESLMRRRNEFVRSCIKQAIGGIRKSKWVGEKTEAVAEERRIVSKEFLATITKGKKCSNCQGVSPSYRKDRYSKIFRKPLGPKEKAQMIQGGFKASNPLVTLHNDRKTALKRKRGSDNLDEGIVADFEDATPDEEEGEPMDILDASADGSAIASEAAAVRDTSKEATEGKSEFISAGEVYAAMVHLFEKEKEIMTLLYRPQNRSKAPATADMFFIKDLVVPPNKYRPEAKTGDGEIAEAQQNTLFKQILTQCDFMNQINKEMKGSISGQNVRQRNFTDLQNAWVRLQDAVNSLIDRDRNPIQGAAGKKNEDGIKQKLEKKEGLFRKNMMGKRVNFAARSVISPDPNIETNEIGVPPVFAKKLTYPEPVTNHNFYELKEAVLNGPDKWPGAAAIENENGQVISLRTKNLEERQALANQLLAASSANMTGSKNKKVHRHLNNGDIVLMNRQPTLHKPSIMGHRARVLPGEKTIRMHYANCNTYNADFDGDEMNMHFPQNEIARAEALQIADTDHQYLVATSGKPLRGLIQDHISMGVWMTNRDTFFTRDDYQQLLYSCLRPESNHTTSQRILTVPPAIIKPVPKWTGKQVITTVLKNIKPPSHPGLSLTSKSSTSSDRWGEKSEEGIVIFKDGELLCGILDKAQLGPSGLGMVHSIYEVYGPTIAGKLLSVLGRLLTKFLHMRAFTCGMDDLVLTRSGEEMRKEKLKDAATVGLEVAAKYVTLDDRKPRSNDPELRLRLEGVLRDDEKQAGLDQVYNARTASLSSGVTGACLPTGLEKSFPRNQMQAMTNSGAKGSSVNANLISCNLGQQVLEGRRVPTMISGKTLPCFKPFDTSVRAGGYITDRFLTGIRPQEYYFHAMAGREGLIDTAVKTSRSGYLQRCLIKGMEGLKVEYDNTVRDSDGTMVQFLYGEDGLDVTKQKHLTQFTFLAENFFSIYEQLGIRDEFQKIISDEAPDWSKTAMKKVKKTGKIDAMDPALARFPPGRFFGSTSESFAEELKKYVDTNPDKKIKDKKQGVEGIVSKKAFNTMLEAKYMKSVIEPGEAVGVVAGQSIGEPSTQMTLNTFHLAGHSTKNVTLGIPRLREIVMTASNHISTPSMTLHLIPELSEQEGERFAKAISKLTLGEIIDKVTVTEKSAQGVAYPRAKIYSVRLDFYPADEYCSQYAINVEDVTRTLENKFVPYLQRIVRSELKKKGEEKTLKQGSKSDALPQIGEASGTIEEAPSRPEAEQEGGDDDEDDDGDDDDATNAKQRQNRAEAVSYAAPDEDEQDIAAQIAREGTPEEDADEEVSTRKSGVSDESGNAVENEKGQSAKGAAKERQNRIMAKNHDVTSFTFDDVHGSWCELQLEYDVSTAKLLMLNLVNSACHHAVIQSIPGLGTCTLTTDKTRDPVTRKEIEFPVVVTDGANLTAMRDYQDIINPHKIFTNDIAAVLQLYGVEACRANIVREMDAVFQGHGISVDNRHLNLIADMMTRGGGFTPFNRNGLKSSVSPFMKMSFETTVGFLRDAALEEDWDDLTNPSSRIVVGKLGKVGTGAFDVMMPVT
ncbi:DNA-directed RNA polymeras-like protein I subunit [Xylona heveae TC161]|uniref:DNA-directed RNA polymerase subunit n=1 Tax=Xylona heveae (strain CBS 132557 / TC161) TaxID=1328760 RepID=A0A165IPN4_XYLHT|nr:DNA-directed RNA polymeras-like protein I subunit [Xylona heveae TC161]KZF25200.1 DNA-directed RNA polymeras-like protein I subunit [Xylona heveae TC161]